jgi:polyisoprenoid-binding protein YceI
MAEMSVMARQGRIVVLFALLVILCPLATAEAKYIFDDAHGLVRFTVKLAGLTDVEGRFTETDAAITYNEADLTKSSVTALIHVASIDTAEKERDQDLCSASFFDVEKFPAIRFQSKRIARRGADWVAIGDFTMHGVTREIELPFQWVQKKQIDPFGNDRIGFEAHTTLKRSDYGILGPSFWGRIISDDVDIVLRISARIYNWDNINGSPSSFVPELLPLFENGNDKALSRLREIREAKDTPYDRDNWQYHVLGRKLYQHGKIKAALDVANQYVEAFPQSSRALDDLADSYEAKGDKKQAILLFEKSAKLDPFDANAVEKLRWVGQ